MSLIVCRAPFRVSFFGGGSDYPEWFKEEPGAVLSTSIDKYIYISCRYLPPFLGTKHRVVWRHVEQSKVSPGRDAALMLWDVIKLSAKRRLRRRP